MVKTVMEKIGPLDLEIILLGMAKDGTFDEGDIAGSNLKRLGVGRTLDLLASLKERDLIDMNTDGSFSVTDLARSVLWDKSLSAQGKILRLLEIRPCSSEEIPKILEMTPEKIFDEMERLRRNSLVLMSPLRVEESLVKMYEILPEGIEAGKKTESDDVPDAQWKQHGILDLVDEIVADIKATGSDMEPALGKLDRLRKRLESNLS